jgi:DNA polymerase (family 10)
MESNRMTTNETLAEIFAQMAQALELTGANAFRVNAHTRASRICSEYPEDFEQLVKREGDDAAKVLTSIEGVGKGTAQKIIEFVETGAMEEHRELLAEVPRTLFEVLRIPGLGPKTVKLMWEQLNIVDIDGVKQAITDESILTLPRMGKKTVANIRDAIEFMERSGGRTPLGIAMPVAEALVETLGKIKGVKRIQYAGSLRRGRETVGDLDLLVAAPKPKAVMDAFTSLPDVEKVLASGDTKSSVRLGLPKNRAIQVDLRVVDEDAYEAALMYFTGSKEHNVAMRERAIRRGLRLNEYGLFPEPPDPDTPPQEQGVEPTALTEADIYAKLDLGFIPPELREETVPIEDAPGIRLLELKDIVAELHSHTVASDGDMTIDELATLAAKQGYHTIAVTDHSASQPVANGLSPERLREHIAAVHEANDARDDITILAGSEVDILADGRLDYEDDLLAELDLVIASPHNALKQEPKVATERLLRAIEHPLVHIIGHPSGRLIGERPGLSPDMKALIDAAVEHDTALEINAHWMRLDLRDSHVRAAVAAGCRISINTDIHHPPGFEQLRYGVLTARRGGLTKDLCINTWPAKKLHKWLKAKRKS